MKGGSVGLYGRRSGDVIVSLQDGSQGEQDASLPDTFIVKELAKRK